jgi:hypothetical protein
MIPGMAKRPGDAGKSPTKPGAVWPADYLCSGRGCGAQVHTLCVQRPQRPAGDDMLTYICPVTRKLTGFRFGDLEWRAVPTCPAGSVAARGKSSA